MTMTDPMTITDAWGIVLEVDDIVVYPGRAGSGMWLTKARVRELSHITDWRGEPQPIIKVERIAEARYGRVEKATGRVTLQRPDRVTRVAANVTRYTDGL